MLKVSRVPGRLQAGNGPITCTSERRSPGIYAFRRTEDTARSATPGQRLTRNSFVPIPNSSDPGLIKMSISGASRGDGQSGRVLHSDGLSSPERGTPMHGNARRDKWLCSCRKPPERHFGGGH